MNYFKYTLLFLYVALNTKAQINYCAQHKATVYKKKLAIAKKQNTTTYIAPESSYDLKFYHLSINVERDTLLISGNVKSLAKVVVPSLDSFAFVLHQNHTIDSVYVNGVKRNFVRRDSLIKAFVGIPILQNQLFEAIVYYHGICPSNNAAAIGDGNSLYVSRNARLPLQTA